MVNAAGIENALSITKKAIPLVSLFLLQAICSFPVKYLALYRTNKPLIPLL